MAGTRFIVLLRGINVNGRSLPMKELREAAQANGFPDCTTYIQSGNLILTAAGGAAEVEAAIEAVIEKAFGMKVEAIARSASALERLVATNPFPEALPKLLHLGFAKRALKPDAAETLALRATHGERIKVIGDALWIDFCEGVADSKITPAALDKAAGSTVTARNWNTLQKVVALLAGE